MLPKSRILSALLLGLGAMLLAWGLLAPHFLHFDGRMPLDLEHTTYSLRDEKAKTRLNQDPDGRVLDAPVTRQLHAEFKDPVDVNSVTVRMGVTTMRESRQADLDRLITASVWSYRLDRFTGLPLTPATVADQPASPTRSVPVDALWVKFPANAEQITYQVFDDTLRKPVPANFAEELSIDGRTVYRYHQDIEPTNVALGYAGPFNTTTFKDGEKGFLFHSGTRDIFVDQHTGMVVDIHEKFDDFYGTAKGEKKEQVLLFDAQLSDTDRAALVQQAASINDGSTIALLNKVAVGVGLVVSIVALLGVFGVGRRKAS
ncbi:DUF3068 domain-containing protein [Corynebacterium epidermidicanis]|uniref:Putative DUF3068 family protein n=1 Tax=Corynebacterium epidermidicanis TaxID=1050174 RepID=A0A0G3GTV0_9CORY|nr:DUF3068 domain-containing protein [Corynebacterium epidermidicanis]AKK02252.1 putative DUF3068 family protein [Corynebacterium epidermidicanis]